MSTLQQRLAQLSPAKAALLAQWQRASLGPNCISVRAGGPQQLFCIHPVSGDVSPYVELAAALPAAYGCIALRASGLLPDETASRNLAQMAAHYAAQIDAAQPHGGLWLGGWSMGGLLAFEAALRLQQQGRQIHGLLLLDSARPRLQAQGMQLSLAGLCQLFAQDLWARHGRQVQGLEQLAQLGEEAAMLDWLQREAQQQGVLQDGAQLAQLRRLFAVCCAHYAAMAQHSSDGVLNAPLLLLQAEAHGAAAQLQALLSWQQRSTHVPQLQVLPGNHYTLLQGAGSARCAAAIHDFMQQQRPIHQPMAAAAL